MGAKFNAPSPLMVAACARTAKILYDVVVNRFVPVVLGALVLACASEPESPPLAPGPQAESAPASRAVGEVKVAEPTAERRAETPSPVAEAVEPEARPSPLVEVPEPPGSPQSDAGEAAAVQSPSPIDKAVVAAPEKGLGVRIAAETESMKLVSLAVGVAVEARTPVGVADRFETIPPRFHCHSVIDSRAPEGTVIHVWRRGARVISRVELEVGKSPAWRTWSRQRIRPEWADIWSCTVTTLEGVELGVATFEVAPAAALPSGP